MRRSSLDSVDISIEREISSHYDEVKKVADYLTEIENVSTAINSGLFSSVVEVVTEPLASSIVAVADIQSDIVSVVTIGGDLQVLAPYTAEISAVAANIDTVLWLSDNIDTLETIAASIVNINTVANDSVNINSVADDLPNIDIVANNISSVNTVSTNINDIVSVANDIVPNLLEILQADANAVIASSAATSATSSATVATDKAVEASASAAAAFSSEIAAATSESNSAISESKAATSESNAASSEAVAVSKSAEALVSATNALMSEQNAKVSETNAKASANAAVISEVNALASANSASISEINAATSENNASTSAANALTSEQASALSEANALISANNALASENAAALSESNAATSESNASISEGNALSYSTTASNAAIQATNAWNSFSGVYTSSPTQPVSADLGDLWYDESSLVMKVYNGTIWVAAYVSLGDALISSNNLSDISDPVQALSNLNGQELLVNQTNIKSINGDSILGSGNLTVSDSTKVPLNGTGATGTWGINVTGNSATATKLATARTITLSGDVTGNTTFDGSGNVSLVATVANDSHTHEFTNLTSKPTTLQGYGITPEELPASIDLNTKTITGLYSQSQNAEATLALNYPVATAGVLEVFAYSSMIHQRYWAYNTDDIYYRAKYSSGDWTPWIKGANVNDNVSSATKLQTARTINGVAFNGTANITVSDSTAVKLTGDQTIDGVKTFSSSPIVPTPTAGDNSTKVATTEYVKATVGDKQDVLVSGTNIKTINNQSLLEGGNLSLGEIPLGGTTLIRKNTIFSSDNFLRYGSDVTTRNRDIIRFAERTVLVNSPQGSFSIISNNKGNVCPGIGRYNSNIVAVVNYTSPSFTVNIIKEGGWEPMSITYPSAYFYPSSVMFNNGNSNVAVDGDKVFILYYPTNTSLGVIKVDTITRSWEEIISIDGVTLTTTGNKIMADNGVILISINDASNNGYLYEYDETSCTFKSSIPRQLTSTIRQIGANSKYYFVHEGYQVSMYQRNVDNTFGDLLDTITGSSMSRITVSENTLLISLTYDQNVYNITDSGALVLRNTFSLTDNTYSFWFLDDNLLAMQYRFSSAYQYRLSLYDLRRTPNFQSILEVSFIGSNIFCGSVIKSSYNELVVTTSSDTIETGGLSFGSPRVIEGTLLPAQGGLTAASYYDTLLRIK